MRKIVLISLISMLATGCSNINEPNTPCGQYGEACYYRVAVNG